MSLGKRWLLPLGILIISILVAVGLFVLKPSLTNLSSAEVVQPAVDEAALTSGEAEPTDCSDDAAADDTCHQGHTQEVAASEEPDGTREGATADCSSASEPNYICYQQRYRDLVHDYGVEAAFAQLKNELATSEFAKSNCHLLTHFIGRSAGDLYGDVGSAYSHGDSFCGSGYYHGAMEAIVEKIGAEKIVEEANTLCANLDGYQKYSLYHYNCAHGLGHGFMDIKDNELFDSLEMCDALANGWERNRCYGGAFMENVVAKDNPGHPSKYLNADQPLYPCDAVKIRYKDECYQRQTTYALEMQDNNFARVFDLCAQVGTDFRPSCYQGLGWDASVQSLKQDTSDAAINQSTSTLCMLGGDYEAQLNCAVGAVDYFIRDSYSDIRAKAYCEYFGADLRARCFQEAEEYYTSLQSPLERRALWSKL